MRQAPVEGQSRFRIFGSPWVMNEAGLTGGAVVLGPADIEFFLTLVLLESRVSFGRLWRFTVATRSMGTNVSPLANANFQRSLLDFARSGSLSGSQLLSACLDSSIIGIGIVDNRLRFEAVNDALAEMLGVSAEQHVGQTVRDTLARGAAHLERQLRKVFSIRRAVPNFQMIAGRTRSTPVRWTGSAFPIRDDSGAVVKAGVILIRGEVYRIEGKFRRRQVARSPSEHVLAPIAMVNRARFRSSLFRTLDDRSLDLVLSAAQITHRSRGEFFCQQSTTATHLYLFTNGRVKLSGVTQAGKEVLIDWMRPGDIIGLGTLVPLPVKYCWTACALDDSTALAWDQATIRGLAACYPSIYEDGLQMALRWVLQLQERLEQVATEMVEQRLAHTILRIAPAGSSDGIAQLRISDEELALMIGTTLFAVSRVITRWQKLGYVQKARKRLLVLNRTGLSQIAEHGEQQDKSVERVPLETGA